MSGISFEEILANNGLPVDETADVSGGISPTPPTETPTTPFTGVIPDRTTIHNPTIIGGFIRNTEIDIKNTTGKNIFNVKRTGANVGDVTIGDYAGGSGALWDYSAGVFSVKGTITATLGEIGGFTIGATTLSSASSEIVLDSANKRIEVGADDAIVLDGTNKRITVGTSNEIIIDGANKRIRSDNYVSGYAGSGFNLDPDLLEVGNIACRGLIRTAVFQKDVINVMGGNFAVLDGDVLDEDMTALDASTMMTKATTTFSTGDILRIKDGTDDEWLEVTAVVGVADSYVVGSSDAWYPLYNGNIIKVGQSFTGNGKTLDKCKFYFTKWGSPTGNAVATIYAHTGTFGGGGTPTGAALATSGNFDVSTLVEGVEELVTFNFTGANRINLTNETNYFVIVEYGGGDVNNEISMGLDVTSPTHNGNAAYYISSWTGDTTTDARFYLYTTDIYTCNRDKKGDYAANTNPTWKKGATVVNYQQSGDGGIYQTASESNAPYLSVFTHAGSPWTDLTTRLRLGNLNGSYGFGADTYGIGIGDSALSGHYLTFDHLSGNIALKGSMTITGGSGIANLSDAGSLAVLDSVGAGNCDTTIIDGGKIITGLLTASNIITGTLDANVVTVSNLTVGTNVGIGTAQDSAGVTTIIGNTVDTGYINALSITTVGAVTAGSLTGLTVTGGTVRTSSGNPRVQMSGANNRIEIYNSNGTNVGFFGRGGANGNFMYINQPDTNEDYPPFYITSAQDSNAMNCFNTNSSISNRAAFRFESNNSNSNSPCGVFNATGGTHALNLYGNSSAGVGTLYISQAGTGASAYLVFTNVGGCFCSKAGVWTDASSKELKENFEDIKVLDIVKNLDIKKYNYISEKKRSKADIKNWLTDRKKREKYSMTDEGRKESPDNEKYLKQKITAKDNIEIEKELTKECDQELKGKVTKHISPMAEDFHKAFGFGDDKGISPKDLAGVALQAIKELTEKVEKLEKKIT